MFYLVNGQLQAATAAAVNVDLDRGWQCALEAVEPWCIRARFTPPGGAREPRTWSIAPNDAGVPWEGRPRGDRSGFSNPAARIEKTAEGARIAAGALSVDVRLKPFGLTWSTPEGRVFAADRPTQAYQASERLTTVRHWMARDLPRRYFGLGDKTGPLDLHGRRLRTLQMDALGYNGQTSDPLYKHWPFYIGQDRESGIAYGVYYDTQSTCAFDFGAEYDNYHGFYSTAEIEDGDLDYYLIAGPRIRDVVSRFATLTGRMAMGPRWSLGFANTAMGLADAPDAERQLSTFIDRAREEDIPISAFHYGSGYSSRGPRRYVFTWNRDKFPDPKALNNKFRDAKIRLVANIKPCLLDDHPAYAEVKRAGGFVHDAKTKEPCIGQFWDGYGAHVDFTHPEGIRWWQQGLAAQVLDYGIDVGWNDNNEYEIWDDWGESHGFGQPIPIDRSRSLQGLLMTRASCEQQARSKPDERVFSVTRAGCPGIQRHAQTWTGDNWTSWHMMRWNIRMGLTMSLSGMFNTGHDIGGFAGPNPDPEMLTRWMQAGALNPRCIMNSWKADGRTNTPWLHPEATPMIREAIRLRYRLMPYLYTQYWRAHRFGEPMLRPTFYEFDDDALAFEDCDEFMVGDALLAAPVVEPGARTRTLYLPTHSDVPTHWVDFYTGEYHRGGARVTVDAPLDCLPMFVRAGAVLPMTAGRDYAALHEEPSRVLHVFPRPTGETAAHSAQPSSQLYEDDGHSHRHAEGDWTVFDFFLRNDNGALVLEATRTGNYKLSYKTVEVVMPQQEKRSLSVKAEVSIEWVVRAQV